MISVQDIIQQSWKVYEENFKTILKITVWGFLAMTFGSIGVYFVDLLFTGHLIVKGFLSFLVNLPQILIALWMTIVLIDFVNKLLGNKKAALSESINKSFKIFWPAFLLSIIVALIETAGFILLIIPGIIFTVWFVFAIYEMILNKKNISDALKTSKELSKNRWFPVAWRYFAPGLLWALAGWAASSILVFAINQILNLANIALGEVGTQILTLILYVCQNAFYIFFVPLIIASVVILYKDLKGGRA